MIAVILNEVVMMPRKSMTKCSTIGCPILTHDTYCDRHRRDRHNEYKRSRTDKKEQSFYSSKAWIQTALYMRSTQPLCARCLVTKGKRVAMKDVDHIVPIKVDWSRRLDKSNLQCLCRSCHIIKTNEDKEKYAHIYSQLND
jgi:5-methylcytosine-specific restriction enzyme A